MPSFAGMFVLCVLFIPLFLFVANTTEAPLYREFLETVTIWGYLLALVMLQHILEGTGVVTSTHHRPRRKVRSDPAWDEMASPLALYGVYAENDESENRDHLPINLFDEQGGIAQGHLNLMGRETDDHLPLNADDDDWPKCVFDSLDGLGHDFSGADISHNGFASGNDSGCWGLSSSNFENVDHVASWPDNDSDK